MTQVFTLAGYIKRDDANYGFLIPIYDSGGRYYFHRLSADSSVIVDFTPYQYDLYEHKENFIPIEQVQNPAFAYRLKIIPKLKNEFQRQRQASPVFVFKFYARVYIGLASNQEFQLEMAYLLNDRRFTNQFLRQEVYDIFAANNDFKHLVESHKAASSAKPQYARRVRRNVSPTGVRGVAATAKAINYTRGA